MLLTGKLAGLQFDCVNIIDFWLVKFAAVKTEKTAAEDIVGWLKNDKNNSWYKSL